jgi:monoterpene epsilon-lactone hydrolase
VVYDALPHAFWYDPKLPEAIEANHIMADFFLKELGK